jgi:hypothetical protein
MNKGDIRTRVFGRCAKTASQKGDIIVNYSTFLERLILFDTFILDSLALKELPYLIRVFGYDPIVAMFDSGALQLGMPGVHIGLWGPPERCDYHSFGAISVNEGEVLKRWFHPLRDVISINNERYGKLANAIEAQVINSPEGTANELIAQFRSDLTSGILAIKEAVMASAVILLNRKTSIDDLRISVEYEGNGETAGTDGYRATSNLGKLLNLDDRQANEVIRHALTSVGGLNRTISEMKRFNALSGCPYSDLPIFDEKLRFLERSFAPNTQVEHFNRILSFKNFPDLGTAALDKKVDLMKLLEIRQSREVKEFRTWLWALDSLTDEDITDRIASVKSMLTKAVHSKAGKRLRWLATNGIGLIPVAGQVLGPALSALDTFLAEKVLRESGVLMFINDLYPSIFTRT